jgi:hypothetical protein
MARQAAHGMKTARLHAHILGFCGANLIAGTCTVWLLQALGRIELRGGWAVFALALLCLGIVLVTRGAQRIATPTPTEGGFRRTL